MGDNGSWFRNMRYALKFGSSMMFEDVDTDRIDDAVLALLFLTLHDADQISGMARA